MSKLRTMVFHASCLSTAVAAALLIAAPGCGKSTRIGNIVAPDGGASGQGGSAAGSTSDGAAGTSSGGDSGGSAGGASGEAGSSGATSAEAGTKTACGLPRPAPIANPTAAEQERAALIRGLCNKLAQDGCLDDLGYSESLGWISDQTWSCPVAERITACEQDLMYSYVNQIPPECEQEWQAMVRCETAADHTVREPRHLPCTFLDPSKPEGPPPERCLAERTARSSCVEGHPKETFVTGARAECWYARGHLDPSLCTVQCALPDMSGTGKNYFHTECSAPPGLPLFCTCSVNGVGIYRPGGSGSPFSASACPEVARLMADGECIELLDCCFKYTDSTGEYCECMSNDDHGMPSCSAAAQAAGGEVVDICPQYKSRNFGCWPPWSDVCKQQP